MPENTIQGYDESEIETGEKVMQSPLTDTLYRVTRWVEKDGGLSVALSKEAVECGYCETRDAVEWSDQGRAQCAECSPTGSAEKTDGSGSG